MPRVTGRQPSELSSDDRRPGLAIAREVDDGHGVVGGAAAGKWIPSADLDFRPADGMPGELRERTGGRSRQALLAQLHLDVGVLVLGRVEEVPIVSWNPEFR
jgi:hypothetical protein